MSQTYQTLALSAEIGVRQEKTSVTMEDLPPNSRIFVVCGKAAEVRRTSEAVTARDAGGELVGLLGRGHPF